MQTAGFAQSRKYIKTLASKLAEKSGIKYRFCVAEGRAAKDWFASFVRRHREISVKKAERTSLSRA
jgi:hypothetical protein